VTTYRYGLAGASAGLGEILLLQGRLSEAEQAHRKALEAQEELARENPADAGFRSELSTSCTQLGFVYLRLGRRDDAERVLRRAVAIAEGLLAESPADGGYRYLLTAGLSRLVILYGSMRRFAEAEQVLRRVLPVQEKLAADFPGALNHRVDLADLQMNWANVLRDTGRHEDAEKAYHQAIEALGRMTADFPAVHEYRRMLGGVYLNLGVLLNSHRPKMAEEAHRKSLEIYERLVAESPSVPDYQSQLGGALNNLAGILRARGELAESRRLCERAVRCQRSALEKTPRNPTYRLFLANHYRGLADTLVLQGDHPEAARATRELVRLESERFFDYERSITVLAECARLAEEDAKLSAKQRQALSREYLTEAKGLLPELTKRLKGDPEALNHVAWFLGMRPEPLLCDAALATALAGRATDRKPQEARYWLTRGLAHYRAGDWPAALAALKKSLELRKGITADGGLILAMTHWQLGEKDQARKCYDQAVRWMDTNQPQNAEVNRFRAEAAALLGIKEGPASITEVLPPKK
jgi:tetratricopeptide (TPR) repeat protein